MSEESTTSRLLQLAGRRAEVPRARAARVRTSVHEAWREQVRRRKVRRALLAAPALLAAAAGIVAVVYLTRPQLPLAPAVVVGTVERVDGMVRISRDEGETNARRLSASDRINAGEWITTNGSARTALRIPNGTSLRVDGGSRLRLLTDRSVELTSGAIYIDTGQESATLEVRTPFGTAADIGTQFEVRLGAESLRVRVRTGAVAVRRGGESIQAGPGTELTMTSKGTESRTVPPFGPEWSWATELAPAFQIDGQALGRCLDHLARENGWSVRYEDPELQRAAAAVVLHGSIEGLDPTAALSVALTTADLSYTLDRGELYVFRPQK